MLVRNGARRQREVAATRGLDGLAAWLTAETEQASRRRPPAGVLEALEQ
jgi:hypothetical protein